MTLLRVVGFGGPPLAEPLGEECQRLGWTIATFANCLAAVLVQMVYTMLLGSGLQARRPSGLVMPALVICIAATLLWFSWFARGRGWIGRVNPTLERE